MKVIILTLKNLLFNPFCKFIIACKDNSTNLPIVAIILSLILISCRTNISNDSVSSSSDLTSQTRVIKHALGETKVPLHPQRVVVIGGLDNVLALGVKPIGSTTMEGNNFPNYLKYKTVGIKKIGMNGQPNLEQILYLKPDLILGIYWDAELYKQLSYIAPTVLVDGDIDWKRWLTQFAEALGQTQKAETLLREYEQRIENLRTKIDEKFFQDKVSVVSFWANYTRLYMNYSFCGSILKEIGLSRPSYQDKDKINENISLELIPQLDGDIIFLILGGDNPLKLKQFTHHPLWSRLQAVKESRVYSVTGETWISAWGIIGANQILGDLLKYLPLRSI
ncbi:iron-siderophore ABC transporter substrate-binding protein [Calothrix sp. PCC 6303]|uniref:iron-siderophore ABC transporter substrate-binding protein n=1 Tax=Calothrix sp. PCC 6303 TaxID=1170562 RepID=UPI0002A022A9|nr:iron-siderophore ABC transporter substrate-binding protein [Calothrix sp. PCC 6303]AFZ01571.1 periplasmic binding protein [Calothrix sp. PCC 6303]